MLDLKKCAENFDKFINSEEGKKITEEFIKKQKNINKINKRHIKILHQKYDDNIDSFIEKVKAKYESDNYRDREWGLGREPMQSLYILLFDYAEKYGKKCKDEKYLNVFTGSAYYIGSYVIQVIYGQGSAILVDKIK